MKRYNELSDQELLDLTEDKIKYLIDLELAYNGIIPALEPTEPINPFKDLEPTEKAYEVGGVLYRSREDADIAAGLKAYLAEYDYFGAGYNYQWLEKVRDLSVATKNFYTQETVKAAKAQLKKYKEDKEQYDKDLKEYERFIHSQSEIESAVRSAVYAVGSKRYKIQQAVIRFGEYLKLAEGNKSIAWNFFTKAYKDSTEDAMYAEFIAAINTAYPDHIEEEAYHA